MNIDNSSPRALKYNGKNYGDNSDILTKGKIYHMSYIKDSSVFVSEFPNVEFDARCFEEIKYK